MGGRLEEREGIAIWFKVLFLVILGNKRGVVGRRLRSVVIG